MIYQLNIALSLISLGSKRLLENRFNATGNVIGSFLSLTVVIAFIQIFFSFSKTIFGWQQFEVFFLAGTFRLVSSVFSMLFYRSIITIEYQVRRGDLDLILTKPLSSQLYLSFQQTKAYELIVAFIGVGLMMYAINMGDFSASIFSWVLLILGLIFGLIILYSLFFMFGTLAIFMGRFQALPEIYDIARQPLSYPFDILGQKASLIFTYLLPLAFIVSIPTKVFFGKAPGFYILLGGLVAMLLLFISNKFWNFALRHYTSASS